MNYIKQISIYIAVIIATITHNCSRGEPESYMQKIFPGAGVAFVKAVDEAIEKNQPALVELAANLGKEAGNGVGAGIAKGLEHIDPMLGNQAAETLGNKIKEAVPTFGREAAEKWAPALEKFANAAVVASVVYGIYQLGSAGRDVYLHFWPNEEKLARIKEARESNKYLGAKQGLRDCLINKARMPKNHEGIPAVCAGFADTYRMVANQAALDEMVTNFKKTFPE